MIMLQYFHGFTNWFKMDFGYDCLSSWRQIITRVVLSGIDRPNEELVI